MQEIDYSRPSDDFAGSIDIHTLLPQQEPFVMIGKLCHFDMNRVVAETTIDAGNLFVNNGLFSAEGLIENIAQTCAARIGYINKYILKKGIQIGFIGAVTNLKITGLPEVGETILTEVCILEEVFGMILASAKVYSGDGLELAVTDMKIAIREEA